MKRSTRCSLMASMLLIVVASGCGLMPGNGSLPVYAMDQTESSRHGYRRTTIKSKGSVFVHDFEEYALALANPDPKEVVGRTSFGNGKICAIEGVSPSAYLAADMGSEMQAYVPMRAEGHPPFDWRRVTFQKMRLAVPEGPAANKETTDAAVIEEVLSTLRDGTPAPAFTVESKGVSSSVHSLMLWSDQLPGLVFTPAVHFDPGGQVYLAENLAAIEIKGTAQVTRASWIPASAAFTQWSKSAD